MNRAAIAFGIVGFAAAGGISASDAPRAAPNIAVVQLVNCSPGSSGQAVQDVEELRVNNRRVRNRRATIKAGDWVKTNAYGTGRVCLRTGATVCDLDAGTRVRILPPRLPKALAWLANGTVTCRMGAGPRTDFETPADTITPGELDGDAQLRATASRADVAGARVLSISVRQRKTVVKVRRGATVVARRANPVGAVVVGRDKKVEVQRGADPRKPQALTAGEKRTFAALERPLGPGDREAPNVAFGRTPRAESSLRRATFSFSSGETVIFSCALDNAVPRVCVAPFSLTSVEAGSHRLTVAATDAAGNTRTAVFAWRVDGSKIAYASDRSGSPDIWIADPDGRNERNLTNSGARDEDPDWSPNQSALVFHSDRDGDVDVYVMSADGSGVRNLTGDSRAIDRNPTWSPDGTRIAFESYRANGNRDVWVMNADGTNARRLTTDDAEDYDPAWSPDSRQIVFASGRDPLGGHEIYVMSADGAAQRRVTPADPAIEFNPAWSPDGSTIAFHSQRSRDYLQIWTIGVDGTGLKRLTATSGNDANPAWSPSGDAIVFQTTRDDHPRAQISQVYVMYPDGSEQTKLTATGGNYVPDW